MKPEELQRRIAQVLECADSKSFGLIKAIALLAEVVNEGAAALEGIREALAEPDADETLTHFRSSAEDSDVELLKAEAENYDIGAETLDERTFIPVQGWQEDLDDLGRREGYMLD